MKKNALLSIASVALVTVVFFACKKSPSTTVTNPETGFDKKAMLTQYADGLIIPAYAEMQGKIAALKTASDAFVASPSEGTQATVKAAFTEAYLQYERIVAFQFGPAETALLDIYLNYSGGLDYSFSTAGQLTGFSVDTATIENNIASGSYDLTAMSRNTLYSQGFPALNYLYCSSGAVSRFSANAANRAKYINDVVQRMKTLVDGVAAKWTTYRTDFAANTQTSSGSPIAAIVNQMAYQLDMMKGPRIGWPFGKQSNGIVFAEKCEGYYAGISRALAIENITALKKLYTDNGSGKGISDYLVSLKKETLNADVLAQFDATLAKLQQVPDPLHTAFAAQPATVDAAYKEIQKLLTLLKTDVASATAVQITFTDNDGD
ncbi:MAG: imelysin family protein [Bacteroidota bacterium]